MDLVLVMLEFLLQARQLLVGELSRALGLLDSESCDTPICDTQREEAEGGGQTLFHSLSSLGSSKVSPSFASWSFRELFSTDRVSLFPSIPYLARITAQPNTDALVIDYPDRSRHRGKLLDAPHNRADSPPTDAMFIILTSFEHILH